MSTTNKYVDKFTIDDETILIRDSEITSELATYKSQVSNRFDILEDEIVITISDSYGRNPSTSTSWTAFIKGYLGLSNSQYYTSSQSGIGFYAGATTFLGLLQGIANNLNATQKQKVKYIIVGGGINDASNGVTNIYNAIGDFCSYAKSTFPNSHIKIAHISRAVNNRNLDMINESIQAYSDCGRYGAEYINGSEYILMNVDALRDDLLHPNEIGSKLIASKIVAGLNNGIRALYRTILTLTAVDGDLTGGNGNVVVSNEITTLTTPSWRFNFGTQKTLSYNKWVTIATVNNNLIYKPLLCLTNSTVLTNENGNNAWYGGSLQFQINNNNELQVRGTLNNSTTQKVDTLIIQPTQWNFNTSLLR